ncbi:peptidoglycan-binding protein [Lysinibacillus sp. 2017]|uniref:LysM peptidoglycan-binding and 3D domain-containing protein n=1 Tax=unclassified Lysinibacillus TaxID=2636778 RepID=UPI000D527FA4|nr:MULTISPECIES: LysM peptidoglycan-binding and 3D domain-containing protein [unclassified Lysinibacillus]AWE06106.1 peptidoglycan-binding protein [Lysinibacillus sp. 2017]TGN29913.1 LysM peptidoglycan-binding domain-containing protein [Lysinibacillus sp. S2017]
MKNKKILAFTTALSLTAGAFVATNSASAEEYTIQPGDSLYTISQQFDTTIESLMEVNHLTSDLIYANETLEVSSNGKVYIIESGDSLFKIAAAHGVTVAQLQAWNGLNSDLIYAGEKLSVSGPLKGVTVATQAKTQVASQKQQATSTPTVASVTPVQSTQAQSAPSNVARTMTVEATAYTANCNGCSGVTANGTNLRANPNSKVIAVDPSVIPLGTKVWVDGYGEAIAADTGGAIKGNRIDVFISDEAGANNWGRRTVTIKILN